MKRSVSRGASGFHLFWYSRRPKRKQRPSAQEVKFDNITKRIRTLCGGLDPRFIDPVPVTQKVVEGAGWWKVPGDVGLAVGGRWHRHVLPVFGGLGRCF